MQAEARNNIILGSHISGIITIVVMSIFVCGCGVKGKPLPPLEPPSIGTGTPDALKQEDKKNSQKR